MKCKSSILKAIKIKIKTIYALVDDGIGGGEGKEVAVVVLFVITAPVVGIAEDEVDEVAVDEGEPAVTAGSLPFRPIPPLFFNSAQGDPNAFRARFPIDPILSTPTSERRLGSAE